MPKAFFPVLRPAPTQDIDLVVDRERLAAVVDEFLAALSSAGFLFGEATVRRSIASGGMFRLLEPDEVVKLDIYTRCLLPGELDRSVRAEIFPDMSLPLVARPDVALPKLIWIHRGSHRSRRDLCWILAGSTSVRGACGREEYGPRHGPRRAPRPSDWRDGRDRRLTARAGACRRLAPRARAGRAANK